MGCESRDSLLTRGKVIFALIAVIAFFGWKNLSVLAHQTAVLHIPAAMRNQDTFVTLWVVEDRQSVWIRAERRQRLWLDLLRGNPIVELTSNGHTVTYRANPLDDLETQAYVDGMFRRKYGRADELRGLVLRRDAVPIRLERP
jgi:hypothetical protein